MVLQFQIPRRASQIVEPFSKIAGWPSVFQTQSPTPNELVLSFLREPFLGLLLKETQRKPTHFGVPPQKQTPHRGCC